MNQLTTPSLKLLMNEYNLSGNTMTDTDEYLKLLDNIKSLSEPDKIILYLYAELQSYRKVGKLLNVSFATIYKTINEIRNKIL